MLQNLYMKMPQWAVLLSLFFAGGLSALAMPPAHIWPVLVITIPFLYLSITGLSPSQWKRAALYGWLFGFGFHICGLYWITFALFVEYDRFWWLIPFAIAGLPAVLALYYALASGLAVILSKAGTITRYLFFVLSLVLVELLRGYLFTGFPWNLTGYSWSGDSAIFQSLSLFGIYGLTCLSIFWFSLPALLLIKTGRRTKTYKIIIVLLAFVSIVGLYTYGTKRLQNPTVFYETINLNIVQPNIAQNDKWNPDLIPQHFRTLLRSSLPTEEQKNENAINLIFWPESAIPPSYAESNITKNIIAETLASYMGTAHLLTGTLRHDEHGFYNSIQSFSRQGHISPPYNKFHLVPFGEYIPLGNYVPIGPIVGFSGFQSGAGPVTQSLPGVPPFSPLICYEIIFPSRVTDHTGTAKWIFNATNDAWYGETSGPYQHLHMARARATEQGIAVIRAANTGISAIIDPYGRILSSAPLATAENVRGHLPQPTPQLTVFVKYGHTFLLFPMIAWLLLLTMRIRKKI